MKAILVSKGMHSSPFHIAILHVKSMILHKIVESVSFECIEKIVAEKLEIICILKLQAMILKIRSQFF